MSATDIGLYHGSYYAQKYFEKNEYAITHYLLVFAILVAIVASAFTFFVVVFRDETEIKSRYAVHLLHLFISLWCCVILVNILVFTGTPVKPHWFSSCLAGTSSFWFYSFFSAINCRHRLMYVLFSQGGKLKGYSYYIPMLWHFPLAAITLLVCLFTYE
eukprot:Pgem_evm1s6944